MHNDHLNVLHADLVHWLLPWSGYEMHLFWCGFSRYLILMNVLCLYCLRSQWHPDVSKDSQAGEVFKCIHLAYQVSKSFFSVDCVSSIWFSNAKLGDLSLGSSVIPYFEYHVLVCQVSCLWSLVLLPLKRRFYRMKQQGFNTIGCLNMTMNPSQEILLIILIMNTN